MRMPGALEGGGRPRARARAGRRWRPRRGTTFAAFALSAILLALVFLARNPRHAVDRGLHGAPRNATAASCGDDGAPPPSDGPYNAIRSRLYADMAGEAAARGITVLDGEGAGAGAARRATQNLTNDSIFDTRAVAAGAAAADARVDAISRGIRPVLHRLDEPVRAVVVPLVGAASARNGEAIERIHRSVVRNLEPLANGNRSNIWVQDHENYHASIFHTSHHLSPTTFRDAGVEDRGALLRHESTVLRELFGEFCAVVLVLERIIVTSGGAVLGLWQVLERDETRANDVSHVRERLRGAFPYAPAKQMSTPYIVHTTFARVIHGVAGAGSSAVGRDSFDAVDRACRQMMAELCGLEVDVDRYWFVEERDLLALALRGDFTAESLPLRCERR